MKSLTYTLDGHKATFEEPEQITLVSHMSQALSMWRETATTYKLAIELLAKKEEDR